MRKRKQEKQIDQQRSDNQINDYQKLKQKILTYKTNILELEEKIEMKQKRNKFIDDEIKLKLRDLNNVEKCFDINKELEISEIKSQSVEQKSNSSTTIYNIQQNQKNLNQQQFLYKQKISQEYFSNSIEKYFQYFEGCIDQEIKENQEIENDNEKIYIPPMIKFHTIQVQCFVKLLDPKLRTQVNYKTADNQDYVTTTFRYSKSDMDKSKQNQFILLIIQSLFVFIIGISLSLIIQLHLKLLIKIKIIIK